eukprot:TRINITY_DN5520_c0_g1_i1.p1 TRINITY_DN5520_c0_g1~~TRINITY_DN5520_c0_g1_i1.p1  ORF type:complete len:227 (-),score=75.54 TRINITY_DN5520_c0_g1_i1:35-664(-)
MSYSAVPPSYDEDGNFVKGNETTQESELKINQTNNNNAQTETKEDSVNNNDSNEKINNNNNTTNPRSKLIAEKLERLQSIRAKKEAMSACKTKRKADTEDSKSKNNNEAKIKGAHKSLSPIAFVSPTQKVIESIKPYMNPNPHLAGVTSRFDPQTTLEKQLNIAVSKGDYDEAERYTHESHCFPIHFKHLLKLNLLGNERDEPNCGLAY